jgi:hypothetical protein
MSPPAAVYSSTVFSRGVLFPAAVWGWGVGLSGIGPSQVRRVPIWRANLSATLPPLPWLCCPPHVCRGHEIITEQAHGNTPLTRSSHDWHVFVLILKHSNCTYYPLTPFPLLCSHQLTSFSLLPTHPLTSVSLLSNHPLHSFLLFPSHTYHRHMTFCFSAFLSHCHPHITS